MIINHRYLSHPSAAICRAAHLLFAPHAWTTALSLRKCAWPVQDAALFHARHGGRGYRGASTVRRPRSSRRPALQAARAGLVHCHEGKSCSPLLAYDMRQACGPNGLCRDTMCHTFLLSVCCMGSAVPANVDSAVPACPALATAGCYMQ